MLVERKNGKRHEEEEEGLILRQRARVYFTVYECRENTKSIFLKILTSRHGLFVIHFGSKTSVSPSFGC